MKASDRTLLDNMVIYANSDQELAKTHSTDGVPMFTAGRAGERPTGDRDPGTRLGYTLQKMMGLDISSWGSQSNKTSSDIGEILV